MKKTKVILVLILFSLIMLTSSGCSSIIAGDNKDIKVTSNPSGAKVEVYDWNGEHVNSGTTPFTVSVKRGSGYFKPAKYEFKGTLPGYQTHVTGFESGINGWYWGNIVFGGLIGMLIVDPITGAMWEPPNDVLIDFSESQTLMIPGKKPDSDMLNDSREWVIAQAQYHLLRE